MDLTVFFGVGAGIAVITGIGAGVGIGVATAGLLGAIARQPEATGKIMPWFWVGVALSEATAFYGLVISIMLISKLPG